MSEPPEGTDRQGNGEEVCDSPTVQLQSSSIMLRSLLPSHACQHFLLSELLVPFGSASRACSLQALIASALLGSTLHLPQSLRRKGQTLSNGKL